MIGKVLFDTGRRSRSLEFRALQDCMTDEALVAWDRDGIGELIPELDTDVDPADEVPRIRPGYPRVCVSVNSYFQPELSLFVGPNMDAFRDPVAVYRDDRWLRRGEFARVLNTREKLMMLGLNERDAKDIELGAMYGMSAQRLLDQIGRRR